MVGSLCKVVCRCQVHTKKEQLVVNAHQKTQIKRRGRSMNKTGERVVPTNNFCLQKLLINSQILDNGTECSVTVT